MNERINEPELLDLLENDSPELRQNLTEMAYLFRLTGGLRLGVEALTPFFNARSQTLLDLGAGNGLVSCWLKQRYPLLEPLLLDGSRLVAGVAAEFHLRPTVVAEASQLPLASGSVDLVWCGQMLHHCSDQQAIALLREVQRVSRYGGVIVDLQRSWLNYWGTQMLRFGPLTRLGQHDGALSVKRAFTVKEISTLADQAGLRYWRLDQRMPYWVLAWQS